MFILSPKPKAIELVVEKGLDNIILESDSLQTISAIQDASLNVFSLGPVIEDAKFLLWSLKLLLPISDAKPIPYMVDPMVQRIHKLGRGKKN